MSGLLNKMAEEMEKKVELRLDTLKKELGAKLDGVEKKVDKLNEKIDKLIEGHA